MLDNKEPYEQGRTDSFYRRRPRAEELYTEQEHIDKYNEGYDYNTEWGEFKDYDDWDMEELQDGC